MRALFRFHGGLHLDDHKEGPTSRPVGTPPIPRQLVIPLQQHIGEPAEPRVKVGDQVAKGELIARSGGPISAPVHASSSGRVIAIEERPATHPSGLNSISIVIETDGEDRWHADLQALGEDYRNQDAATLRETVARSGIVGLGGAGFPTAVKLTPRRQSAVETLILNGAECEPYISCDDMLMREYAQDIVTGALIMQHALHARRILIAIEDNKPQALAAVSRAVQEREDTSIEVIAVPTLYPTGGERQLIRVLTGQAIPAETIPIERGIVCHNVATAYAVFRAVYQGIPLISRIVTVTGQVGEERNLEVLLGTPIIELLEYCGTAGDEINEVIIGGPMMGFALHQLDSPVIKTCNCIIARKEKQVLPQGEPVSSMPCIRCGKCADVCPADLLPQQMYWHARAHEFDRVQEYHLFDCIECGCCDFVCPSHLPLVQYYRFAKSEIWAQEREKRKSDIARQRHEFRQMRLQREKQERAARHKRKAATLNKSSQDKALEAKKAAIQAAVERVKAKKAEQQVVPKNTENLTDWQQKMIEEVDARRAGRHKTTLPGQDADVQKED